MELQIYVHPFWIVQNVMKEANVLFHDTLNTFSYG